MARFRHLPHYSGLFVVAAPLRCVINAFGSVGCGAVPLLYDDRSHSFIYPFVIALPDYLPRCLLATAVTRPGAWRRYIHRLPSDRLPAGVIDISEALRLPHRLIRPLPLLPATSILFVDDLPLLTIVVTFYSSRGGTTLLPDGEDLLYSVVYVAIHSTLGLF